ncbi:MAG: nucleotidyltransferase family protein [Isosphaerales bacterium]
MNTQESRFTELLIDEDLMERMVRAVEKVRDRMHRAARALEEAGIPYAVIGGNAVAAHVGRVDESSVRNTQDVDILLRRVDLEAAKSALAKAGFNYRHVKGIDMFLDGPKAKARDAVHLIFAGERVRAGDPVPAPEIGESEATPLYRVVALDSLVKMKLTSFRDKDRMHLRDMLDVGLVDESWLPRLPAELSTRLKELLDNPEG